MWQLLLHMKPTVPIKSSPRGATFAVAVVGQLSPLARGTSSIKSAEGLPFAASAETLDRRGGCGGTYGAGAEVKAISIVLDAVGRQLGRHFARASHSHRRLRRKR
jgi:hypothetical protein